MMEGRRLPGLPDPERVQRTDLMESIPSSVSQIQPFSLPLPHPSPIPTSPLLPHPASLHPPQIDSSRQDSLFNERSSRGLFLYTQQTQCKPRANVHVGAGVGRSSKQGKIQLFEHNQVLREIIKKYKIKAIVNNFVRKVKRTSVFSQPVEFHANQSFQKGFLNKDHAFELPTLAENLLSVLCILQVLGLAILSSISLVYMEVRDSQTANYFQIYCTLLSLVELFVNLTTVKYSSGKKLRSFLEIWKFYAKGSLAIDLCTTLILFAGNFVDSPILVYLKMLIFFRIPQCLDRIQKLEVFFISNFYNEQYWSLVKILLFNFSFAHVIAIFLTAMTFLNPGDNWMTAKGIEDRVWYEQYVWSYYWANTIMLTVGFGDLVASNYEEALCLVFIETFSCMALAYNINCVGGLIQHIRSQDAERSRKSKIFKKLTDKNCLPQEISWKINNYIEQNAELHKKFNFQQEKELIASLPGEMKKQYLKESNKKIFESILFFKAFVSKTLYNLAEGIEMRVSHPEEVIQHVDDDYNLIILKAGQIGFACRKSTFLPKDFIMDAISLKQTDNPRLLNLDFILRKRIPHELRSLQYCIFFFLPYSKFIEILRLTEMDYEFYCTMRDRMKNVPDQFEVMECSLCQGKHLKAICPKLHFIPYYETIIHRYLHREKTHRNGRFPLERTNVRYEHAFRVYSKAHSSVAKLGSIVPHKRRKRSYLEASDSQGSMSLKEETIVEREIRIISEKYTNPTNEIIKDELNRMRQIDNEQDEVWQLKADQLADFNGYFNNHNPLHIATRLHGPTPAFRSDNLAQAHTTIILNHRSPHPRSRPHRSRAHPSLHSF